MASFGSHKPDYSSMPVEYPESEVQDIDNPEDWTIAEIKYGLMMEKQRK